MEFSVLTERAVDLIATLSKSSYKKHANKAIYNLGLYSREDQEGEMDVQKKIIADLNSLHGADPLYLEACQGAGGK
jgi:hypothetical protein